MWLKVGSGGLCSPDWKASSNKLAWPGAAPLLTGLLLRPLLCVGVSPLSKSVLLLFQLVTAKKQTQLRSCQVDSMTFRCNRVRRNRGYQSHKRAAKTMTGYKITDKTFGAQSLMMLTKSRFLCFYSTFSKCLNLQKISRLVSLNKG